MTATFQPSVDENGPCIVIKPDRGSMAEKKMFREFCEKFLFVEKVRDKMDKSVVLELRIGALGKDLTKYE